MATQFITRRMTLAELRAANKTQMAEERQERKSFYLSCGLSELDAEEKMTEEDNEQEEVAKEGWKACFTSR